MKFFLGLISCLVFEFLSSNLIVQDQNLIRHCVIPETNEHDTIRFGMMFPPSYNNNDQHYPVIYYLHGMNGHYSDWKGQLIAEFFTNTSKNGELPECILVFPEGGEGFWFNHYDGKPLLEEEIVEFLIPFIDQNYPVDVDSRLIMGWSSGGAGAMAFFSKHPTLFKAVVSLDGPNITWEEFQYFQGERTEIVNNSNYYYQNCSPFDWVARNQKLIKEKQDTALFIATALFAKSHQKFLSILNEHKIPFKYKVLDCNHEFGCVFAEINNDLLSFLSMTLE